MMIQRVRHNIFTHVFMISMVLIFGFVQMSCGRCGLGEVAMTSTFYDYQWQYEILEVTVNEYDDTGLTNSTVLDGYEPIQMAESDGGSDDLENIKGRLNVKPKFPDGTAIDLTLFLGKKWDDVEEGAVVTSIGEFFTGHSDYIEMNLFSQTNYVTVNDHVNSRVRTVGYDSYRSKFFPPLFVNTKTNKGYQVSSKYVPIHYEDGEREDIGTGTVEVVVLFDVISIDGPEVHDTFNGCNN